MPASTRSMRSASVSPRATKRARGQPRKPPGNAQKTLSSTAPVSAKPTRKQRRVPRSENTRSASQKSRLTPVEEVASDQMAANHEDKTHEDGEPADSASSWPFDTSRDDMIASLQELDTDAEYLLDLFYFRSQEELAELPNKLHNTARQAFLRRQNRFADTVSIFKQPTNAFIQPNVLVRAILDLDRHPLGKSRTALHAQDVFVKANLATLAVLALRFESAEGFSADDLRDVDDTIVRDLSAAPTFSNPDSPRRALFDIALGIRTQLAISALHENVESDQPTDPDLVLARVFLNETKEDGFDLERALRSKRQTVLKDWSFPSADEKSSALPSNWIALTLERITAIRQFFSPATNAHAVPRDVDIDNLGEAFPMHICRDAIFEIALHYGDDLNASIRNCGNVSAIIESIKGHREEFIEASSAIPEGRTRSFTASGAAHFRSLLRSTGVESSLRTGKISRAAPVNKGPTAIASRRDDDPPPQNEDEVDGESDQGMFVRQPRESARTRTATRTHPGVLNGHKRVRSQASNGDRVTTNDPSEVHDDADPDENEVAIPGPDEDTEIEVSQDRGYQNSSLDVNRLALRRREASKIALTKKRKQRSPEAHEEAEQERPRKTARNFDDTYRVPTDSESLSSEAASPARERDRPHLDYEQIKQQSRAVSQASRVTQFKPRKPRTEWSPQEIKYLIKMIEKYGPAYSEIKKKDHQEIFHLRDQGALKDKARNLKYDYVLARAGNPDIEFPKNLDSVQLNKALQQGLREKGVEYYQEAQRARN